MYYAYSKRLRNIVHANDVRDVNEIFYCPTPDCPATLRIRSIDGKVAPHFWVAPNCIPHRADCVCGIAGTPHYTQKLIKFPLESILLGTKSFSKANPILPLDNKLYKESDVSYIRTPKELFQYCGSHSLDTEYLDGCKVGDIIVDRRNSDKQVWELQHSTEPQIKLVFAKTSRYIKNTYSIQAYILLSTGLQEIVVKMEPRLYNTVKEYILASHTDGDNKKFANAPIAILGYWTYDSQEKILTTTVSRRQCFIYRFN